MIDIPNSDSTPDDSQAGAPEPAAPPIETGESAPSNLPLSDAEVSVPVPAPRPARRKPNNVINPYIWGTGRRKTAVARVRRPTRYGVGIQLLKGLIEYEVAGTVKLDFDPTGVVCVIEIPLGQPT